VARFHVHGLKHSDALVLDLQSDLLDQLTTRMVVPLLPPDDLPRIISQLNPQFTVRGKTYVMATQFAGAISIGEIGDMVADLTSDSDRIVAATDFLFQGF
jgi:toxin CcdB